MSMAPSTEADLVHPAATGAAATPMRYRCMPRPMIENETMRLETIQPEHIERVRLWRNMQMNVLRQAEILTQKQQHAYFSRHVWPLLECSQPRNILLSCTVSGELVGYAALVHMNWRDQRAELSFLLDPGLSGDESVYARFFAAYLSLVSELAFEDLGLNRLFTETYAFRSAHIAVLEASGFLHEGLMREHCSIEGRMVDSVLHGRLAKEWWADRP